MTPRHVTTLRSARGEPVTLRVIDLLVDADNREILLTRHAAHDYTVHAVPVLPEFDVAAFTDGLRVFLGVFVDAARTAWLEIARDLSPLLAEHTTQVVLTTDRDDLARWADNRGPTP